MRPVVLRLTGYLVRRGLLPKDLSHPPYPLLLKLRLVAKDFDAGAATIVSGAVSDLSDRVFKAATLILLGNTTKLR